VEEYVELSRYRLFRRGEEAITLGEEPGEYTLSGPTDLGTVTAVDVVKQQLSTLVNTLNERFGADLTENDGLSFAQLEDHLAADPRLAAQARANDAEHYAVVFADALNDGLVDLVIRHQHLFGNLQDNAEFRRIVEEYIRPRVYARQREAGG